MTGPRKLNANRANSLRSTGPKTIAGRARAAGNARRHGLRVPVLADPALSAEVEAMARNITGDTDPELIELARRIAEAHVDVIRVRQARGKVWHAYVCPENRPDLNSARKLTVGSDLAIFERYERRALSRRKFAIRAFDEARAKRS